MGARPGLTAVAGALALAFSGILVRLADVEPATAAAFRCAYALPALWLLARLESRRHGRPGGRERRLAWAAGLLFAADLELWHHSIAAVGAGLSTVLANTQVVVVALAAWALLGEKPTARVVGAIPVVLGGVVLISGVVGAGAYGDDPALGVVTGLGAAVAYAGFLLVLRAGSADLRRTAWPLLDATLAAALASVVIGLALGELDPLPGWEAQAWLVLLALSAQVLAWLVIATALPRLPAALASLLLLVQPAAAVGAAMAVLDESPSAVQLTGIAVVLGGIGLATVGRRPQRDMSEPT